VALSNAAVVSIADALKVDPLRLLNNRAHNSSVGNVTKALAPHQVQAIPLGDERARLSRERILDSFSHAIPA
jgi:hypothetical protein